MVTDEETNGKNIDEDDGTDDDSYDSSGSLSLSPMSHSPSDLILAGEELTSSDDSHPVPQTEAPISLPSPTPTPTTETESILVEKEQELEPQTSSTSIIPTPLPVEDPIIEQKEELSSVSDSTSLPTAASEHVESLPSPSTTQLVEPSPTPSTTTTELVESSPSPATTETVVSSSAETPKTTETTTTEEKSPDGTKSDSTSETKRKTSKASKKDPEAGGSLGRKGGGGLFGRKKSGKDKKKDKSGKDKAKDKMKRKGSVVPSEESSPSTNGTSPIAKSSSISGEEGLSTKSNVADTSKLNGTAEPASTTQASPRGPPMIKPLPVVASDSFRGKKPIVEDEATKKAKIEKALGEWGAPTVKVEKDKGKKGKTSKKGTKGKDLPQSASTPGIGSSSTTPLLTSTSSSSVTTKSPIIVGVHGIEGRKESKEHAKLRMLSTMELDHSKSNLSKLPEELPKYVNLKVLNLSTNRLTALPSSFGLTALTTLLLSHNQLTDIPSKSILHMPRLSLVDLSHNAFESIPSEFSTLTALKSLQLDHNKLTSLFDLTKLKSLERLSAENNQLKQLPKSLGLHLTTNLTSLNLSHNRLDSIPLMPPSVSELLLHSNQLEPASFDSLMTCASSLKRLSVGNNRLASFPVALHGLTNLEHLFIENNIIEEIALSPLSPDVGIHKMTGLKQLDLGRNKLRSVPAGLGQLTQLERLHLNDNALKSLPSELSALTKLTYLDVEDNPGFDETTMPRVRTRAEVAAATATFTTASSGFDRRDGGGDAAAAVAAAIALVAAEREARPISPSAYENNPLLAPLNVPKDDPFELKIYIDKEKSNLFKDLGTSADMNRVGLARGKKDQLKRRNRQILHKMEDDFCIYAPLYEDTTKALFCLFDGHAGPETANIATHLFPKELAQRAKALPPDCMDMSGLLKDTFLAVDEMLKEEHQCVGATATVVILWTVGEDRYLQSSNLGDSYAFLCRAGTPIQLVQEHKLSVPSEFERIVASGIQLAPGQTRINGLAVTRALGDHFAKENGSGMIAEPHVSAVYKLQPEDQFLLLASDGLWDSISGENALKIITTDNMVGASAQEQADYLMKRCLGCENCQDNVAIVVVHL